MVAKALQSLSTAGAHDIETSANCLFVNFSRCVGTLDIDNIMADFVARTPERHSVFDVFRSK